MIPVESLASGNYRPYLRAFLLLCAVLAASFGSGCAAPFHLVHDGANHPAEFRNGALRPAGAVPDIRDHVIAVDGQGVPHDPRSPDGRALGMQEFRGQVAGILAAMRRFHAGRPDRKVLIFVHGGLNAPADSLAAADDEIERVMDAGSFPIFLNWNSDLLDTYGEHAARITQGQTDDGLARRLLSPLYVFADVGRAVTRAPVVWSNQIGTDLAAAGADLKALSGESRTHDHQGGGRTLEPDSRPAGAAVMAERWARSPRGKAVADLYTHLKQAQEQDRSNRWPGERRREIRVYIGPDLDVDGGHLAGLAAAYALTLPAKLATSPLIDGLGTPSWQNMSRRTLMAFDGQLGGNPGSPAGQLEKDRQSVQGAPREQRVANAVDFNTAGAFAVFREELLKVVGDRPAPDGRPAAGSRPAPAADTEPTGGGGAAPARPYDLTLIGHSMGTMVLNEWLRRDLIEEQGRRKPFYAHIVYMAAACSVRDFGRSVVPYLVQHGPDAAASDPARAAGTQFYNLMLHPLADLREREFNDIPPRGSLLVWLDDFLADPQTPLDRTLGRWDNLVHATEVIPLEVRGRVSLKAFALAPGSGDSPRPGRSDYGPQMHGQFRGRPYWCPAFWYSESPVVPPGCGAAEESVVGAATTASSPGQSGRGRHSGSGFIP